MSPIRTQLDEIINCLPEQEQILLFEVAKKLYRMMFRLRQTWKIYSQREQSTHEVKQSATKTLIGISGSFQDIFAQDMDANPHKKYVSVHAREIYLYTLISRRGHKILIFYSLGYTSINVIKYQHREDAPFLCDPTTEYLIPHKKLLI